MLSKSKVAKQIPYKGQYYSLSDLSRIYSIPVRTLSVRYHSGDREDRLVRPPDHRFLSSFTREKMNKKRERLGELAYASDIEWTNMPRDDLDKEELIEHAKVEFEHLYVEPENELTGNQINNNMGVNYYG